MAQFMDLRAFILRARVLKFYRQALRMTRRAPEHTRGPLFLYLALILLCAAIIEVYANYVCRTLSR
jgi:hypothetical protein